VTSDNVNKKGTVSGNNCINIDQTVSEYNFFVINWSLYLLE